jgi:hypothetical protein
MEEFTYVTWRVIEERRETKMKRCAETDPNEYPNSSLKP